MSEYRSRIIFYYKHEYNASYFCYRIMLGCVCYYDSESNTQMHRICISVTAVMVHYPNNFELLLIDGTEGDEKLCRTDGLHSGTSHLLYAYQ